MQGSKAFDVEVLVVGGGVAGASAAITASRRGLRTLLLEKEITLGGLATNNYVNGVAGMVEGRCKEWLDRLDAEGHLIPRPHLPMFDPDRAKLMLERMILERGGRLLYGVYAVETEAEDGRIKDVVCYGKSGRLKIGAKVFIDATGDADIAVAAGAPYEVGSPEFFGLNMSTTLAFRMANVDLARYWQAAADFEKAKASHGNMMMWTCQMEKAVSEGFLPSFIFPVALMYQVPGTPEGDADISVMTTHSFHTRNTDVEDLTRQIVEQHQQMLLIEKFVHKYIPGFERARISGLSSQHGVRDSRRIVGDYVFKAADIVYGTKFDDGIARFPEMLDTHHPTDARLGFKRHVHVEEAKGSGLFREAGCGVDMHPFGRPSGIEGRPNPRDYCDIPFRSLVPAKVENLFLAGRCVSAEFDAVGAVRVIATAMGTGQAAAVAADMCVRRGQTAHQIDGKAVRRAMIEEEGVPLDKPCDGHWQELREAEGELFVGAGDFVRIRTPDGRVLR